VKLFASYSNKTDEALMVLVQGGDHRAFSQLYDRYAGRLKAFFRRMLWLDDELAEDQVHDLFTKIIDRPELYKAEYRFKSWVFQIASNMCKNMYRKRSFEQEYRAQLVNEGIGFMDPGKKIDEEVLMDILAKALETMDEDLMTLFLLRNQQDMSIAELARIFDVPEGTIKSRLFQIRKELAQLLTEEKQLKQ
jgi:RNA polymerase sigma-70 factor (ECF subfamily)